MRELSLMTIAERLKGYTTILKEEGFDPKQSGEGILSFKFEYLPYTIELEDNDPEYFRLVFRDFCKIENAAGHLGALGAALHATAGSKVAKVSVIDGEIVASVELYLASPEYFRPIVKRSLNSLQAAVNRFLDFPRDSYTSIF